MTAKKCPGCGKERCPGIVMRLDCPELRHVEGWNVTKSPYIPGRYDEAVTFILDIWERTPAITPVTSEQNKVTNKVTPRQNIVTNGEIVVTRRRGRPRLGVQPLTHAERQRRYRGKA